MKRQYRLRKNADFQRVRREGESVANRFMVLIARPNQQQHSRFGFAVSKRLGKSVKRNKIKRQMREAARLRKEAIQDGWDFVFIARSAIQNASYQQIEQSLYQLLDKLTLFKEHQQDSDYVDSS